jgi:HK97 gp10 family phage protein
MVTCIGWRSIGAEYLLIFEGAIVADVEFSLIGLDSLLGKIASINDDLKRKGGRAALRKAAKLVADAAKNNAAQIDDPATGRSIASNVALRWNGRVFKRSGDLAFRVGILGGARLTRKNEEVGTGAGTKTPHWRLLEFGFLNKKSGLLVPAQPVMRRALADNIDAATKTFVKEYEKSIDRAIKRALKKASL